MCREPVDDPRLTGRARTTGDLVMELSLLLNHARFYGRDHQHVRDTIEDVLETLAALLAESGDRPIEIGTADGFLIHDQRPLLGTDRAAVRLVPFLEQVGSGGIALGPRTRARDFEALLDLAARRDAGTMGLDAANDLLEAEGAHGLRLLGVYAVGSGPTDLATRTLGTTQEEESRSGKRALLTVPERVYEGVFEHLTDVMIRLVRGDLFMFEDTRDNVATMLETLSEDASALLDPVARRTARADMYQFRHSIRVACLALTFARELIPDRELLIRFGAAALLHDVGKRYVSERVLRHDGPLSDEMRSEMEQHPVRGAGVLLQLPTQDPLAIATAFGHHRCLNQRGYPHVRHPASLSPATRLVKICDVYEALTAERPYKAPYPPRQAYRIMMKMEGHFDRALLHRFILVNGIWPLGGRVRFESGAVGRVKRQTGDLDRPIVQLDGREDFVDLTDGRHDELGAIAGLEETRDDLGSLRLGGNGAGRA